MVTFVLFFADADGNGWNHMDGWGGGWMWLWGVAMMVSVVTLIVWMIRATDRPSAGPTPRDPADRAKEILAERYAKGDLSTEEYRERVSQLQ
jgi:putative membrane protein